MKWISVCVMSALLLARIASAQEFGPWSQPVNLGSEINTSSDDMHPTLSKDGLTMIFSSNRPGGAGGIDLWLSERDSADAAWLTPQNLTMLNTRFDDHAPNLTKDGHWLFFYSTRPGGCNDGAGRTELWTSHRRNKRDDFGWEPPINLGCILNVVGADEGAPSHWQDDDTGINYLYFARNYTPSNSNGLQIYVSTCSADLDSCNEQQLWTPAAYIPEINSSGFRNTRTAIRQRDGLEMLITSNRPGTTGNLDLWVTTRTSVQDAWSLPVNLNQDNVDKNGQPIVNSTANDAAAALSWDGQTMIFYSNRAGGFGGNDLYMSTRARLRDVERSPDTVRTH